MSKFSFSVSSGFATLNNISVLNNSITNNISVPLQTINPYGDAIEIIFTDDLNDEQKVTLNNLVTSWDNNTHVTYNQIVSIPIRTTDVNTTYKRYAAYSYLGSSVVGEIKKVTIMAYMDNLTNYCVRLYDATNSKIMVESVFTNKTEDIMDLGPITNIPQTKAIIEIHLKKSGGTVNDRVHAEIIMFYS